jgi:hypothetical protein
MANQVQGALLPDNGDLNPVSVKIVSGGSGAVITVPNGQTTASGPFPAIPGAVVIMGWDGDEHREVLVDSLGNFNITTTAAKLDVKQTHRRDYSASGITDAYTTLFTSATGTAMQAISIFESGGKTTILGWGSVDHLIIPPGGIDIEMAIPASSVVQIKVADASGTVSQGELIINLLG